MSTIRRDSEKKLGSGGKNKCLASNPSRLQSSNYIRSFFIIQYHSSYTVVPALCHF